MHPTPPGSWLALVALLAALSAATDPPGSVVLPRSVFDNLSSIQFTAFNRYALVQSKIH